MSGIDALVSAVVILILLGHFVFSRRSKQRMRQGSGRLNS
jgi:hypothetical protein